MTRFYKLKWGQQVAIVIDRSQPFNERLDALRWIDNQSGFDGTSDGNDLGQRADELRDEVLAKV
jgi:hypothetical protein